MRYLVAGTAGHIDHGKSELVRALTGINPDRLKEEQERGITIDIGFAHLDLEGVRLAFVDVPGHERFVKNMLAGACGIDMVLLVVASDESIKPQTREHFDICRLLGIRTGLIALTKIDLVEPDIRETVQLEVADFVRGTFLEKAPIIPVSARSGESLPELREALGRVAADVPHRAEGGLARLPIDRSFSVRGFGTVVTGTLVSGMLEDGAEIEVLPGGGRGRIRGLQVHGEPVSSARAGQRTAVNIQGLTTEQTPRGKVLVSPGTLNPSRMIDARVTVLKDSPIPLKDLSRVRFHAGTSEILARVRTLEEETIGAGQSGYVQIRLESPAVVAPRDRFIIRRYSPARTIAGGVVLDGAPAKHRRGESGLVERLEKLSGGDLEGSVGVFVEAEGDSGFSMTVLAGRCGATADETHRAVVNLSERGVVAIIPADPPRVVSAEALSALRKRVLRLLSEFHRKEPLESGMPREVLRAKLLREGPPEVFRYTLEALVGGGEVRIEADRVALPSHRVELGGEERKLREQMEGQLLRAGLDPPALHEVLPASKSAKGSAEKILHMLLKEGRLARLPDGRVVHVNVLTELRHKLYRFRRKSEVIDIATFKDLAGVSRKNAIPLLELFDSEKVTVRRGNERVILPET
jgi:selenocysteine-specific elongation factor